VSGRRRLLLFLATAAAGAGIGIAAAVRASHGSSSPPASAAYVSWAAGVRRAPSFSLHDQHGRALTSAGLRGRVTVVSFIDPVCRNFCPLEAKELTRAVHDLGASAPALVAVSVNPPFDSARTFAQDARVWRLPPTWRWGLGPARTLARVWRDYAIGVQVRRKTIAGVTVRDVVHTEAAYVIDANGDERALFVWPYRAADLEKVVRSLQ
jgi:cytochrome oxidase Cu insertion factor (SCO1/SenC/PrrC family)